MKFLRWFLFILLGLLALILIVGAFLPKKVEATATTEIEMSRDKVFYSIATFNERQLWDPWLEMEPEAKVEISVSDNYVGSEYNWDGEKLGQGRMLVDSVAFPSLIKSSIWFRPDSDPAGVVWNLEDLNGSTRASWTLVMESGNPFMKIMNTLMKGSLLKSFNKGLENLKSHLETNGVTMSKLGDIKIVEKAPMLALIAEGNGHMDNMQEIMGELFGVVMMASFEQGIEAAGPPFAMYYNYNPEEGTTSIKAGIPISKKGVITDGVSFETFGSFKGISAMHKGPYTEFASSYTKMMKEIETRGLEATWESWEYYHTDPGMEADQSRWLTEIVFVIKEK